MTGHLFDSDIIIDLRTGVPEVLTLVDPILPDGLIVSVITVMEVYQGLLRRPDAGEAGGELERFLVDVAIVPVTRGIAERCAEIRSGLQRRGRSVRPRALDLLVAATAVETGLTLVTRNVAEFRDVPRLRLLTPATT